MIATSFCLLMGIYLACGLAFAVPFVFVGAPRVDPHAANSGWGFRLVLIPGVMALWPLLLRRWIQGVPEPPSERTAHRQPLPKSRS